MNRLSTELVQRLNRKGLRQDDLHFFKNDIENLKIECKDLSNKMINRELEELGWGIEIINREMFGSIIMFLEKLDTKKQSTAMISQI